MRKVQFLPLFLLIIFLLSMQVFAQGQKYEGPDDPASDKAAEREGYMTGNRVFLYFQNNTELAKWVASTDPPLWSKWPNNPTGVKMLDGVALLIGAKVYVIENDTIPVTDPTEIAQGYKFIDGQLKKIVPLYFLQTSYREEMDTDINGQVEWGLYPVFGYFNPANEYPAMSNIPGSWPGSWPASGHSTKWPGEWNGRFGRGVIYADLETYFVANDAQDQEYLGISDPEKYYPRPGVKIGDDISIQKGFPWGGIGIRVEQRGFQWNNPQARDAIFWEYKIANISDYDLPEVAFGYWVDNGIGGEADDEIGFFDRLEDMAYSWDKDQVGRAGLRTGLMGFAYLESPGLPFDGVDNDLDGITDEQRDNQAQMMVGPTDGIDNIQNFLDFYKLDFSDLKDHWDADEDQDWQDGNDVNQNGMYAYYDDVTGEWFPEPGENANDDVGTDGVGPFDLNYQGPDPDGSECNHKPDYNPQIGCEPNFATTDVSESDMVGLTAFQLFPVPSHSSSFHWFRGDESMWDIIGTDSTQEYYGTISNLIETFASGPFPLYQGREERVSMALVHAYESNYAALNNDAKHPAPTLYQALRIVKSIYAADYRFAQPPEMPTLTATAGDGQVVLTWDNIADTRTRDPFLGNINDFEGYKIYRSTDVNFTDRQTITDGYGVPFYQNPIFQCDLIDGRFGFAEYGIVSGITYNLGSETGIVHHFVDQDVQNGRTYYYALVAYDYGDEEIGGGITPSENNVVFDFDEYNNLRSMGQNVAIVTPGVRASGYVPPSVEDMENENLLGEAETNIDILSNNAIKADHEYSIKFSDDTLNIHANGQTKSSLLNGIVYTTNGLYIHDETENGNLVYKENKDQYSFDNVRQVVRFELGSIDTLRYYSLKTGQELATDVFDGLSLRMNMPYEIATRDIANTGWAVGYSNMNLSYNRVESIYEGGIYYYPFPWDYDIVFTDNDAEYTGRTKPTLLLDEAGNLLRSTSLITGHSFNFYVENKSFLNANNEYERMDLIVHDVNRNDTLDYDTDRILVGTVDSLNNYVATIFAIDFHNVAGEEGMPKPNDTYRIRFNRPMWSSDVISFKVNSAGELNTEAISTGMDNIRVVPNPYIATNSMEQSVRNPLLNQSRKIRFDNVPSRCIIRIFTVSGYLVKTIDVDNLPENGMVFWDLLTNEGLEVAAGIYIYHVKSNDTGDTKMGKFAIIK